MRCKQSNEFNNSLVTDQQIEISENVDSISNQDEEPEEFETLTVEQLRLQ